VADFGLRPSDIEWSLNCNPDPNCVEPGSIALLQIKLGGLSAEAVQGI
jgi:hypothetical protein